MLRPECQYFRKERYPTNEDETHFEIIPWCDCNGRPDHADHAKLRDALVQALEVCTTWLTARPAPDNVHYKAKAIAEARAALALAKESK